MVALKLVRYGWMPPASEVAMLPAEIQKLVENEYSRTSIRVKIKQLSRRKNFGSSCPEDIEQDLRLHLLGQAAWFDGDRSC